MRERVYFAGCTGRIKIGSSRSPYSRIREISLHLFDEVKVLATIPGCRGLERAIHKKLWHHHVRNEWFVDCDAVRSLMEEVIARGPECVAEFYKPLNHTRGAYITASSKNSLNSLTTNPWDVLLRRLYDLDVCGGRVDGWRECGMHRFMESARRELIDLYDKALPLESDVEALSAAFDHVWAANNKAEEVAGRRIDGCFTLKNWTRIRKDMEAETAAMAEIQRQH